MISIPELRSARPLVPADPTADEAVGADVNLSVTTFKFVFMSFKSRVIWSSVGWLKLGCTDPFPFDLFAVGCCVL